MKKERPTRVLVGLARPPTSVMFAVPGSRSKRVKVPLAGSRWMSRRSKMVEKFSEPTEPSCWMKLLLALVPRSLVVIVS